MAELYRYWEYPDMGIQSAWKSVLASIVLRRVMLFYSLPWLSNRLKRLGVFIATRARCFASDCWTIGRSSGSLTFFFLHITL